MQASTGELFSPGEVQRTVLVVEDEELLREMISMALEDAGFLVIEAGTAEEGLGVLMNRPVNALLTDIRLPGAMDGWQLAERARSIDPNLPVIYVTGYSAHMPERVANSIFLRKPYMPSAIIEAIEKLIGDVDR